MTRRAQLSRASRRCSAARKPRWSPTARPSPPTRCSKLKGARVALFTNARFEDLIDREIAEVWAQRFQDKAIAFYFLPDDRLRSFPFDYYKVQHVVSNLLDNALKLHRLRPERCGCTSNPTSGSDARVSASLR